MLIECSVRERKKSRVLGEAQVVRRGAHGEIAVKRP